MGFNAVGVGWGQKTHDLEQQKTGAAGVSGLRPQLAGGASLAATTRAAAEPAGGQVVPPRGQACQAGQTVDNS
jgi:hypothetical protein